ncbi:hypothetical protein B1757_09860 [Acidithiobacillus marinus]|uniref:Uncharacterized protein n=1 Tax=Acidithiobacillus marinus TaxID=187490 RepID=A0A2I1DKL5_9PROT|nr:hypothetical protein [Acidithiobacillus marinus]PKY10396.1 hypothetical protein B1757_09860 [Acidithiobacillus marinus]
MHPEDSLPDYEIKAFYSLRITLLFVLIYGAISLFVLSLYVFLYWYIGAYHCAMVPFLAIGGFMGGFVVLQKYPPTQIIIRQHNFHYAVRNVEEVIAELAVLWAQERRFYGFAWGYKIELKNDEDTLFIPLGMPKYPDGILIKIFPLGHRFLQKLTKYGGVTTVVEVKKEGEDVLIYGPLVTLKKIYDEIT